MFFCFRICRSWMSGCTQVISGWFPLQTSSFPWNNIDLSPLRICLSLSAHNTCFAFWNLLPICWMILAGRHLWSSSCPATCSVYSNQTRSLGDVPSCVLNTPKSTKWSRKSFPTLIILEFLVVSVQGHGKGKAIPCSHPILLLL